MRAHRSQSAVGWNIPAHRYAPRPRTVGGSLVLRLGRSSTIEMNHFLSYALAGITLLVALLAPLHVVAQPTPPPPGRTFPPSVLKMMREDPEAFQFKHAWKRRAAMAKVNRLALEAGASKLPAATAAYGTAVAGTCRVPVLLGEFAGSTRTQNTPETFEEMLFTGPSGTLNDYYDEVSYGRIDMGGDVYGWEEVSQTSAYYAADKFGLNTDTRMDEFLTEMLDGLDPVIDFRQFNNDGPDGVPNSLDDDGYVDVVCFVHENVGAEVTDDSTTFWSHRSTFSRKSPDAVPYVTDDLGPGGFGPLLVNDYIICPARNDSDDLIEIGVFAHELGHIFGLPDLYDLYTYENIDEPAPVDCATSAGAGVGGWCLMGSGNWNDPASPSHMCAWSKAELGWLSPGAVATDLLNWRLESATTSQTAYKLWKAGNVDQEYFLLERRTQEGFDASLPAEGVLIWHVNEAVLDDNDDIGANGNECLPLIDLECADQIATDHTVDHDALAAGLNRGDVGDTWMPGMVFSSVGVPSSVAYSGAETPVVVFIDSPDTVDMLVGALALDEELCIRDCPSDACSEPSGCSVWWDSPDIWFDNNNDGVKDLPVIGENLAKVTVRNLGADDAEDCWVSLYYQNPFVGLEMPGELTSLGAVRVPMIEAFGQITVDIPVDVPYATLAYAATVDYLAPFVGSDDGKAFNNVALTCVPSIIDNLDAGPNKDLVTYSSSQVVTVTNHAAATRSYEVVLGSPPGYGDAIIPPEWTRDIAPSLFTLAPGATQAVTIYVSKTNAVDGDFIYLPITVRRTPPSGAVLGGSKLRWEIDDVRPAQPQDLRAILSLTNPTDNEPERRPVVATWNDPGIDVLGNPDEVAFWQVYRGPGPNFPAIDSFLVKSAAIDEDSETPGLQFFTDTADSPGPAWYKVVAVDQGGNRSQPAAAQLEILRPVRPGTDVDPAGLPDPLVRFHPNPARTTTRIEFSLDRESVVDISIHDTAGRMLRSYSTTYGPGLHELAWDHRTDDDKVIGSGIYFVNVRIDDWTTTKKVVVLE
jgi:M6 family metalloprotease-like protein